MELPNESEARTYRLPIGFCFDPSDEVLTGYYLRKKILSQPLPHNFIPECDVFQTEPWRLQGGGRHLNWQKYFFYDPKDRVFENTVKIGAGNGEWRAVERGEQIELSSIQMIAQRNTYVFWERNDNNFIRSNWVMKEFHLALNSNPSLRFCMGVYRIFEMEGRRAKKLRMSGEEASTSGNDGEANDVTPTIGDLTQEYGSVASTSQVE
ncbi:NAC domain-containing protein 41 [Cajanus cajan]|uniref:NAC domain-containing protein 7 n=1 Tax=Cajanus cajan TaxID=3821 RepID=A0A151SM05_CAJCA|nr:NAC domain-containing protein 41 [Cajanus cajan]KYP55876.1 NAC domain-containing protein 7 [Cajanus cajan]